MRLSPEECRRRFTAARRAVFASTDESGRPHLVPVTFAVDGSTVITAIDHKPKTTTRLKRLANIEARPEVSLLVDHYDDDWTALWWVRADGSARIVTNSDDPRLDLLATRYPPYRENRPAGPLIEIRVTTWRGWAYES